MKHALKVFRMAATACLAAGVLWPAVAGAHAAYKDSDPKDEATVSQPPSLVWAEYTEPPTEDSWLRIYDPCGVRVDDGTPIVAGERITIRMNADKAGTYRVEWRVISRLDSHPTSGLFIFTSSGGSACADSGGGSGGSGGSGSGGGSNSGGSGGTAVGSGSSGSTDDAGTVGGGKSGGKKGKKSNQAEGPSGDDDPAAADDSGVELAGASPVGGLGDPTESDDTSLWDLPIGAFIAALLVAAVIGSAGGLVYAGIMGPNRRY